MGDILLPIVLALISSGTVCTILIKVVNAILDHRFNHDPHTEALQMILKRQIQQECFEFIKAGEITYAQLRYLEKEHRCYHDGLKGNGDLDDLMSAVRKVTVKYE